MSLNVLVDLNLSPDWLHIFHAAGWSASHWSAIGPLTADDSAIMEWARQNQHLVFTHDLDFGTCLALSRSAGPSVFQVRTQDVLPSAIGSLVVDTMRRYEMELLQGALIVLDEARARVRILPLSPRPS